MECQVTRMKEQLEEVNNFIRINEFVGFDTETSSMLPFDGKLLAVQIGDFNTQYVIDVQTIGIDNLLPTLNLLKDTIVIGHNLKFDLKWMHYHGIKVDKVFDTFLAECLLTAGLDKENRHLSLQACVSNYFGVRLDKSIRSKIIYEGFSDRVIRYCAEDVKYLSLLRKRQLEKIEEWELEKVMDLENRFVKVLMLMEYYGPIIDTKKWTEVYTLVEKTLGKTVEQLNNIILHNDKLKKYINTEPQLGLEFPDFNNKVADKVLINWSSPIQKLKLLHGLDINVKSTEAKDLIRKRDKHPIVPLLIKYSKWNKLSTSFGRNFLKFIHPVTGRIHPDYFQIIASGRLSCSKPNLLNIPSHGDLAKKIRASFIPKYGNKIVGGDYSNFELRIISEFADEPLWTTTFAEDRDLHSELCTRIFNIREDQVNDPFPLKPDFTYRHVQKIIDFGLSYGMTEFKLGDLLDIPTREARKLINSFFITIPRVKKILSIWAYAATSRGYIRTAPPYRRIRWFPNWNEDLSKVEPYLISAIEREAKNTVPQGSNADCIKEALCLVQDEIDNNNYPVKIMLSIYDEIVTDCKKEFTEEWKVILETLMIKAAKEILKITPVKVNVTISDHWIKD